MSKPSKIKTHLFKAVGTAFIWAGALPLFLMVVVAIFGVLVPSLIMAVFASPLIWIGVKLHPEYNIEYEDGENPTLVKKPVENVIPFKIKED